MIHGKKVKQIVESAVPGTVLQWGYHGCNRASIQVFHKASGHGSGNPLLDMDCNCSGWGDGKLSCSTDGIIETCRARLAKVSKE